MRGEVGGPMVRRPRRRGRSPRQLSKSEAMRALALETTIQCLADRPYSEVSLAAIAQRGNLSRGGVQYHFPTRLALLKAAIEYLHERRLETFRHDLASCPPGADLLDHMVDISWKRMGERHFRAYQELVLAARGEPELAVVLQACHRSYMRAWQEIARSVFGWDVTRPAVAKAGIIGHFLLDGMAFGRIGGRLSEAEVEDLLGYVKAILREATRGAASH